MTHVKGKEDCKFKWEDRIFQIGHECIGSKGHKGTHICHCDTVHKNVEQLKQSQKKKGRT